MDQQPAMTGSQLIDEYIAALDAELLIYTTAQGKPYNLTTWGYQKLITTTDRKLASLFAGSKKTDAERVTQLELLFRKNSSTHPTLVKTIKEALNTKKANTSSKESAQEAIKKVISVLEDLDDVTLDVFKANIDEINQTKAEPNPTLTDAAIAEMQNGQILRGARVYKGKDEDDVGLNFHLVKHNNKIYLFYNNNGDYEISTVSDIERYCTTGYKTTLAEKANFKLNSLSDPKLFTPPLDQKLTKLLESLEKTPSLALSPEDRSLLLMISGVFTTSIADNFKRPLNREEMTDFLRFLTGGITAVKDPAFVARLALCNQTELTKIKTAFGAADSFASEFFQGSDYSPYVRDQLVALGPDVVGVKEDIKKAILADEKYCYYNVGAHAFGLVFGKPDTGGKRKIYIQDSTETNTDIIKASYKTAIAKIYTDDYEIVKTVKQKDSTKRMFAGTAATAQGIQNQCRYSAIIFSERVLLGLAKDESFRTGSIEYGEKDFVEAFAGYFDKSAMGIGASSKPTNRKLPEPPKPDQSQLPKSGQLPLKPEQAAAVEEKPKPIVAGLNPAFANATYIEGLSDHMPVSFTVDGKRILTLNLLRRCTSSTTKVNGDKVGSNNPYNAEETPEQYAARFCQQIRFLVEAAKTHDFIALQEADVLNENPELLKELLLALSEDYGITRETGQDYAADSNDKKHLHPRGLATIYNKKKYTLGATTLHCEISKAPKAQSPYQKHHAMITAYTTKDSGELISVGNMHLDSEEAKTQIAELNKALLTTNLGVIVGDTNSPRVANASCFGIDEATCYDSITKVKNGYKVKDTVSAKIPGNGGPKTAFHGTDDAALEPTNKTPTKKSYDVALIKAGPTKDIDAWVNAGKYVSVADEKEKFTDYSIQPKVTIARGKSYDLNEKPSPKPKIADAETLKTTAAIKNAISELVDPKKTPDKDNAAVKAAIKDKFEAALETQKAEIAPKKAYRGIGLEANVVNLTEDIVALKIGDIFEEGLARFFADDEKTAMGAGDLKTKLAGKFIIRVGNVDINTLADEKGGKDNPDFLKAVVEMFHGAGNLEFTVTDKSHNTSTQIKCERNIFVAHTCNCSTAKAALTTAGKKGAQYNPETHGIEALEGSEKITEAATAALAGKGKSK